MNTTEPNVRLEVYSLHPELREFMKEVMRREFWPIGRIIFKTGEVFIVTCQTEAEDIIDGLCDIGQITRACRNHLLAEVWKSDLKKEFSPHVVAILHEKMRDQNNKEF